MAYLSPTALNNLRLYTYKAIDRSLVSRYVLGPYWNWFITLWPLTVAPNTITLLGSLIVVFNLFTLLLYDPMYHTNKDGPDGLPQWIYFTWALGLFMYQTLDAVDGKQARRTGMASPLGELFDHGCDALFTTLEVILASKALNLGRSWWTVTSQIAALANFYLSTWEEHHTGIMYFGPFSGRIEGILVIVLVYIITGIFGPSFWDQRLLAFARLGDHVVIPDVVDVCLNEGFIVLSVFVLALNSVSSWRNVYKTTRSTGKSTLKPLVLLLPFVVPTVLQVLWLVQPSFGHSHVLHSPLFVPVMCAWGLQFGHHLLMVILSHVTNMPFPLWSSMWLWTALGVVDAHLPDLLDRPPILQSTPTRTALFVYATLALSLFVYLHFCVVVIREIAGYLGMGCFTVRKRDASVALNGSCNYKWS